MAASPRHPRSPFLSASCEWRLRGATLGVCNSNISVAFDRSQRLKARFNLVTYGIAEAIPDTNHEFFRSL